MKSGFTLIELLVVLVIVSLASMLVVPRIVAPLGGLSLKTAAKKTAGMLRYTQSRSASDKITRIGVFDLDSRRISIFPIPAEKAGDEEEKALAEPAPDMVYDLPKGVFFEKAVLGKEEVKTGKAQILFFPNGSSSGGEILLSNPAGRRYGIKVEFITGAVTLHPQDKL